MVQNGLKTVILGALYSNPNMPGSLSYTSQRDVW